MSDQLREAVVQYFAGERAEVAAFLAVSLAILGAGAAFVFAGDAFLKGLGGVLVVSGIIGTATALPLLLRDEGLKAEVLSASRPAGEAARSEATRMDKVISNYVWYRGMYVAAVLAACALGLFFRRPMTEGIAVGLFLFAAMGFTIDHYSETRARTYREALARGGGVESVPQ